MKPKPIHWRYSPRRAWCSADVGDDTTNVASDDKAEVTCKRCLKTIAHFGGAR